MKGERFLLTMTQKSIQIKDVYGAGYSDLPLEEAPAALVGLSPKAEAIAWYFILGDQCNRRAMRAVIVDMAATIRARVARAKVKQIDEVGSLRLAIRLFVDIVGNNHCARCEGRGEIQDEQGLVTTCDLCMGSGNGYSTQEKLARSAGVSPSTWNNGRYVYRTACDDASTSLTVAIDEIGRHLYTEFTCEHAAIR